jgi:hypothetical protein
MKKYGVNFPAEGRGYEEQEDLVGTKIGFLIAVVFSQRFSIRVISRPTA